MDEDWYCQKLQTLKIPEERLTTLTEIHIRLNESGNLEKNVTDRLLSSPELYDCFDDVKEGHIAKQVDVACEILTICMSNLSFAENDSCMILKQALSHPRSEVRALALNTIYKEIQKAGTDSDISNPIISNDVIMDIFEALQEEKVDVGIPAMNILSIVLLNHLDSKFVIDSLLRTLNKNDTIKCRVYELAVELARYSATVLNKVEFLLDRALSELDNDDVLMQVNILEILIPLAEQNHTLIYLEKRQVLDIMSKRISNFDTNIADTLVIPGIIRFFGKLSLIQSQKIIVGFPQIVEYVFNCLHSTDTGILPVAFNTFANLANTSQGKLLLAKHYDSSLNVLLRNYIPHIRNIPADLKNFAFNALESIYTPSDEVSPQICDVLYQWFQLLTSNLNMQPFFDFCQNPFSDIKLACLNFIKSLCLYEWGVMAVRNTAGFVEFLLDRKIEFDKEVKYTKYEIIRLLAQSSSFEEQTQIQLNTYINEGPYFVQSVVDIAVESN